MNVQIWAFVSSITTGGKSIISFSSFTAGLPSTRSGRVLAVQAIGQSTTCLLILLREADLASLVSSTLRETTREAFVIVRTLKCCLFLIGVLLTTTVNAGR